MKKIINQILIFFMAIVLFVLCDVSLFAQNGELNQRMPVVSDQDLIVRIADVTENALFYPVEIDGMKMEVLAVRAPDGTIRTAFNTCQVCYASGRGYFVQTGAVLVCQNCGNRYRMSQIERRSGGCNPVPIFPANKTQSDSTITISKEFLTRSRGIFAAWRR